MRLPLTGDDPTKIDEEEAIKMVRYAIDHGVNYLDTAYIYHSSGYNQGSAEPLLAKALKEGYREKTKIATKLPVWLIETREDMDKYLNEQLKLLETDYIDFYMIHNITIYWDKLKELGFEDFLDQAIAEGKIKYAGFSFHDRVELFKEVVDYYDWSMCTIQYNYLDENYQAGKEGLKYAFNKGLGIAVMEPLRGGVLATNIPQEVQEVFDRSNIKRSPAEWALRWVLDHPEVSVVLSGMNTIEQVKENLNTAKDTQTCSLTPEEVDIINEAKTIFKDKLKIGCTNCGYCIPCPSGVNIPENFATYNEYYLFGSEKTKDYYRFVYSARIYPEKRASNCNECGQCEKMCPQGISIIKELKKVKLLYE